MPAHDHHPVVTSIVLKEAAGKVRDDIVVIVADDNDAANGVETSLPLLLLLTALLLMRLIRQIKIWIQAVAQMVLALPEKEILIPSIVGLLILQANLVSCTTTD